MKVDVLLVPWTLILFLGLLLSFLLLYSSFASVLHFLLLSAPPLHSLIRTPHDLLYNNS